MRQQALDLAAIHFRTEPRLVKTALEVYRIEHSAEAFEYRLSRYNSFNEDFKAATLSQI